MIKDFKRNIQKLWKLISTMLFIALLIAFFFGPLIPFSPAKIGYDSVESKKAVVYIRDKSLLKPFYANTDTIMSDIENLYGLKYTNPIQIFVTLDYEELGKYIPWLDYKGLGGVALQVGDVIYINTKKIAERQYSEEEFVRHELVHSLISQHASLMDNLEIDRQVWLSEGIATYFGGPNYLTKEEFLHILGEKKPDFFNLNPDEPKFNYTLYRYFIQYLMDTFGKEKFQTFLKAYIEDPREYRKLFSDMYGISFEDALKGFEGAYR